MLGKVTVDQLVNLSKDFKDSSSHIVLKIFENVEYILEWMNFLHASTQHLKNKHKNCIFNICI